MKVLKCDRCGDIYPFDYRSSTIQINNESKIDLCEKCMSEFELWLSNKGTNKLNNETDGEIESTN